MPADITPSVRTPDPSSPTEIIRRAVNAVIASGMTVSTVPDLGVHCVSSHGARWEVDQRIRVLSPLGAVLLMLQPHISDADSALASVLGVNVLWVIGFGDGAGGEKRAHDVTGPAARLYGEGFVSGLEFRAIMHRRAGVPAEREPEAPGALAQAVGAALVSEVLEALAESMAGRGWPVDDAAEATEAFREWARDYRRDGR